MERIRQRRDVEQDKRKLERSPVKNLSFGPPGLSDDGLVGKAKSQSGIFIVNKNLYSVLDAISNHITLTKMGVNNTLISRWELGRKLALPSNPATIRINQWLQTLS